MLDILLDTLMDALKLLPFLFITFYIMEYIEHKLSDKSKEKIEKSGKYGPIIGSILGVFPQCGFSVAATNLYRTRVITLGTLISIYLATSDEMLPILLSYKVDITLIIGILIVKVIIGMMTGLVIDRLVHRNKDMNITDLCEEEHCHCEHNHSLLKSSIKHTLSIFMFILVVELILNVAIGFIGYDSLEKIFLKDSIFGSFLTSLIGLIPNCGASVIITELYLKEVITLGSMFAGLLTGSGVALLVLFKTNKNFKENLDILLILYTTGVISGIIIDLVNIILGI